MCSRNNRRGGQYRLIQSIIMTKLQRLRNRAVSIFTAKGDITIPTLIDYQLDAWCRDKLGLPDRPEGQAPYEGWLTDERQPLPSQMQTSQTGIDLIKRWEGFRSKAYICPGNVWTIGYGHTAGVKRGDTVTRLTAEQMLKQDVKVNEAAVSRWVKGPLNQNQFDALVSFTFNLGEDNLRKSTLLKLLNQGKYESVPSELMRWIYADKKRSPGLISRRQAEGKLFAS